MAEIETGALHNGAGAEHPATGKDSREPCFRVLVTGGLGFVGSAIVRALQQHHPEWIVCILDVENGPGESLQDEYDELDLLRSCSYEYVQADITDFNVVMRVFDRVRPDAVVHTAGIVPPLRERYSRRMESVVKRVNVMGTRHVVEAARSVECRAFVYTSSCCAVVDDMTKPYPNIDERWPTPKKSSIYGESKIEAEKIVLAANRSHISPEKVVVCDGESSSAMLTCVLRPSVIFGEGDHQLTPSLHACIAKGESRFIVGDGCNLWDATYVGNVADAHVLALANLLGVGSRREEPQADMNEQLPEIGGNGVPSAAGETFFIQNNEPISFRDFSLAVWKEFGHYPPWLEIRIPEGLGWILGLVAEVFTRISGTPTTLSRGSVMDAVAMRYASGDKASRILGYHPRTGLEVGIRKSCRVSNVTCLHSHLLVFCKAATRIWPQEQVLTKCNVIQDYARRLEKGRRLRAHDD
ncbi:hypothetical protein PV08_09692 [Exophiala spinifera]|uniref:3-beta hydroxysteroid dehydrogenase/isomerase domain-containing protein n=1 Tax=Exophiala spinifera TaxID=91928 RepID=A0A0D2B165_9EURO|nr:uncharacterized protein PV08_09692 [Exophiala spinifera]KIW12415.1 hypothetical protein PV08_09692 [Exophiala spinifera]